MDSNTEVVNINPPQTPQEWAYAQGYADGKTAALAEAIERLAQLGIEVAENREALGLGALEG